jgi:hypothetical protein
MVKPGTGGSIYMFTIFIPRTCRVGDKADVRINMEPARVTWADDRTLVINDTDRRVIHRCDATFDGRGDEVWRLVCGDATD